MYVDDLTFLKCFYFEVTVNVDVLLHFEVRELLNTLVESRVCNPGVFYRQRRGDVRLVGKMSESGTVVSSFILEIFKYEKQLEKGFQCLFQILFRFYTNSSVERLDNLGNIH